MCLCRGEQKLNYCEPIGKQGKGETRSYRHPKAIQDFIWKYDNNIGTMQEAFLSSVAQYPKNNCLGSRNKEGAYEFKTYQEVHDMAKNLGSGMQKLGLIPPTVASDDYKKYQLKLVGIFSKNRMQWSILDISNMLYNGVMVPLYDTLGPESISFVLEHSGITTCFCSGASIKTLLKTHKYGKLKYIVNFDQAEVDDDTKRKFEESKISILSYNEVVEAGKKTPKEFEKVVPDDCITFSYTSGTTGNPKGAMLSHQNSISCITNMCYSSIKVEHTDVYLSYLPLPHCYERMVQYAFYAMGGSIGFYQGDVLKLKEDLGTLQPTVFASVPRLYNQFYEQMMQGVQALTGVKRSMFDSAFATKLKNLREQAQYNHWFWDKVIFSQFRQVLGGRVRYMVTGSAPIGKQVLEFFQIAMGCPFIEGYGSTESAAGSFTTDQNDPESGHVGGVQTSLQFKLVDVPDMNYTSKDVNEEGNPMPRGEVCMRGPQIFMGYFQDEEQTQQAIDSDGWLHSGDIGVVLPNGALKIVDRQKNIFKLAQGEYVAPEKIENCYLRARGINEVFVHGDSLQNYTVCVIFPNPEILPKIAEQNQISGSYEELTKNPEINQIMLKILDEHGRKDGLNGFERVQQLYMISQSLSEYGCLTNTFQLQRHTARNVFKQEIEEMYQSK